MRIGITMGDAAGVGPELIIRAFGGGELPGDFLIVGDYSVLEYCSRVLDYPVPLRRAGHVTDIREGFLNILDLSLLEEKDIVVGEISARTGETSVRYVEEAVRLALDGSINAMVTLPVNKEAVRLSRRDFTGHTELIAHMCGQDNYTMMLASDKLRVTHVSTHVSMEEAVRLVTRDRVYNVIRLTWDSLKSFIPVPRIAVAGLNAHAGENGSFGREDADEIRPAVEKARGGGLEVSGPLPPDTVFLKAARGQFDAVVCMYHDQGHIPMKLLDFEGGVNITLGLKVIRTSVDHGTAFDIAYRGIASTRSLAAAYNYAVKLAGNK